MCCTVTALMVFIALHTWATFVALGVGYAVGAGQFLTESLAMPMGHASRARRSAHPNKHSTG
jgi:hypothetical protein